VPSREGIATSTYLLTYLLTYWPIYDVILTRFQYAIMLQRMVAYPIGDLSRIHSFLLRSTNYTDYKITSRGVLTEASRRFVNDDRAFS